MEKTYGVVRKEKIWDKEYAEIQKKIDAKREAQNIKVDQRNFMK